MILFNSMKKETAITTAGAFSLPTADAFAGIENYINAIASKGFLQSLCYSLLITITSVIAILVCCSMCAWYITRVHNKVNSTIYMLCLFSMIVPFQMVMFTLARTADTLKLNTPYTIPIIYLGFGAGLAVFMFSGFIKSIPLEIEEAAAIDGCGPIRTYFNVGRALPGDLVREFSVDGSGARNGCCHPEDDQSAGRYGNHMGIHEIPAPSSERSVGHRMLVQ